MQGRVNREDPTLLGKTKRRAKDLVIPATGGEEDKGGTHDTTTFSGTEVHNQNGNKLFSD
jgi:hypothetical protein